MEHFIEGQLTGRVLACSEGYEIRSLWVDRYGSGSPIETPVVVAKGLVGRVVPVMQNRRARSLHRQFARLAKGRNGVTREKVLDFANRYGLLDGTVQAFERCGRMPDGSWRYDLYKFPRDLYWDWVFEPYEMASLIALWELMRDAPSNVVAHRRFTEHVRWKDGQIQFYDGLDANRPKNKAGFFQPDIAPMPRSYDECPEWNIIFDEMAPHHKQIFETYPMLRGPRPDLALAARLYLYGTVTCNLSNCCSAVMTIERSPASALLFEPVNLRAALWLHFAHEMMGSGPELQRCANAGCVVMFSVRRGKYFCSTACRVGNLRAKRRQIPIRGPASE